MGDVPDLDEIVVELAGRRIEGGWDRLRRYCGLPWSGGRPETWAYQYYDAVTTQRVDRVDPVDVLAAGALHPGLSREELAFFHEESEALVDWLAAIPPDMPLWEADDPMLDHVGDFVDWDMPVSVTLLSKVLHRKRPRLVPLIDRHTLDWYRPVTGQRSAQRAWRPLLQALHEEQSVPEHRFLLGMLAAGVSRETGRVMSLLRVADIVLWTRAQWRSA